MQWKAVSLSPGALELHIGFSTVSNALQDLEQLRIWLQALRKHPKHPIE